MSSRFVAAGTEQDPVSADDEWNKARQEVDSVRTSKLDSKARPDDGKSLYEVLQANKAAKQEAFEEAAKLKNQFRTLDDSEVAFLESVHERERSKEIAAKQETAEQLELFRKQRAAADQAALEATQAQSTVPTSSSAVTTDSWVSSKKRRRTDKGGEVVPPAKQKKTSVEEKVDSTVSNPTSTPTDPKTVKQSDDKISMNAPASNGESSKLSKKPPIVSGLGLGAYSSDEDD